MHLSLHNVANTDRSTALNLAAVCESTPHWNVAIGSINLIRPYKTKAWWISVAPERFLSHKWTALPAVTNCSDAIWQSTLVNASSPVNVANIYTTKRCKHVRIGAFCTHILCLRTASFNVNCKSPHFDCFIVTAWKECVVFRWNTHSSNTWIVRSNCPQCLSVNDDTWENKKSQLDKFKLFCCIPHFDI